MNRLFLTFFYSGLSPKAPGTAGTLAGVPFALLLLAYVPPVTLFLLALLITVIAVKAINAEEARSGIHDAGEIVIDEVAGVWIALAIAPGAMIPFESYSQLNYALLVPAVLSVLYFRIFDIWKPSFIGRIDKEVKGGWGVMGDDIAAGFVAGIASAVSWELWLRVTA